MLTLIRRELLDNLMTFRFAAAVFIMLLLVVANTVVLIEDYERRLAGHNAAVEMHQRQLHEKKTYSSGLTRLYVDRPPNPLSIFNVGFDKQLGNQIRVSHSFVPTLWDAHMHGSSNPFMDMFASMDIIFIFEVILGLLALLFAYDAFAGEYENGTLRLVLTHPVRRGNILVAKYISAMVCLIVPLAISLLLSLILLTISSSVFLNTDDFLRIGGIIFTLCCVSFGILSHWIIDFDCDAPNEYSVDVLYVRVGIFGTGVPKCDSHCDPAAPRLRRRARHPLSIK